jgi:hypothetical protein
VHDVPHALAHPLAAPGPRPLASIVGPGTTVLAEEPTVDYRLGRAPIILDTYLTRQVLHKHPDQQHALVERIHAHEFDVVTFNEDPTADPTRFRDETFSVPVVDEILRSYHLSSVTDGYWVYIPNSRQ